MQRSFAHALCRLLVLAALFVPTSAGASSHKSTDEFLNIASMRLLPGWMREDGLYMAAIQIDLAPGWKTYWRQPGAGGIAPSFDWSKSRNLEQVGYFWPAPEIIEDYGLRTIGYTRQLILPVLLKPRNPDSAISARLTMDYGVCLDVCVPVASTDSRQFAEGLVSNRTLIGDAVSRRPISGRAAGMVSATCEVARSGQEFELQARLTFAGQAPELKSVLVETGSETLWVSDADHDTQARTVTVSADLKYYGEGAWSLNRSKFRFTLLGRDGAIDVQGCTG